MSLFEAWNMGFIVALPLQINLSMQFVECTYTKCHTAIQLENLQVRNINVTAFGVKVLSN